MTTATDAFARLHPSLQYHVVNTLGFRDLRPVQAATTGPVLDGENLVVLAPTAGGKTEAAFFPLLSAILAEGRPAVSTLYVSPLRALLNNQEDRVERLCGMVGRRAFKWHGDVPARARQELQKDPADVLLTTPESLEVMLLSAKVAAATLFTHVRAIVIDEVHAFAADDRGAHLMALLERIIAFARHDVQRIGLSATVGNPAEILRWLQGSSRRPGRVVDPPRPEGAAAPEVHLDYVGSLEIAARFTCEMHPGSKRLVFCDSRGQSEELCARLREKGADAHVVHSSLSVGERERAERALMAGSDVVVVATSALELGIDVGDLDHVYQVGCPSTVAAFLQRMGRTGRRPETRASFTFLTLERKQHLSLLQAAGLLRLWRSGFVEPVQPSRRAFHVLVHQLLALALQEEGVPRSDWWRWIEDATPFHEITVGERETLVAHLLERQILVSDGVRLILGPEGERLYGGKNFLELYGVFDSPPALAVVHGNTTIGHLDTMFVLQRERRPAVFALAGKSWRIKHVDWKRRQAHVEPSAEAGKSAWTGTPLDLSWELCQAMRSVLTDEGKDPGWTRRATQMIDALRADQAFLRGPAPIREATGVEWWSFAGNRANAVLALELEARLGVGVAVTWDNLRINVAGQVSAQAVHAATQAMRAGIDEARAQAYATTAARGRLSKFQPCLPQALEGAFLAERVVDVQAACKTVGVAVTEKIERAAHEPAAGSLPVPRVMRRLVDEEVHRFDEEALAPASTGEHAVDSTGTPSGSDPDESPRRAATDAPLAAIDRAAARLRRGLDAQFPAVRPPPPERSEREQRTEWTSELVVGADGQIAIETPPLAGLPGFVKRLEVRAGDAHVTPVMASNLRTRAWHTPVPPSATRYAWSAPGFEDELDEDLGRLNQAGLDATSITVFLLDGGGIGRRANGPLRRGRTYRLVLPPSISSDPGALPTTDLGNGWHTAEVEVPTTPGSSEEAVLERLGLRAAVVGASLAWIGAPPLRHERGHRGARWAVFTVDEAPSLEVSLPPGAAGTILVVGERPGQEVRLEGLEGRALVELGGLEPGRFVAELLTGDDSGGARLPFVVVRDESPRLPAARFVVRLRQRDVQVTGVQRVRRDLGTLAAEDLELRAPPLWTVRAGWSGLTEVEVAPLVASEEGTIDGTPLVERFAPLWKSERRGDLWLDAGDLGRLVFQHTATPDPSALRQRLRALRDERRSAWAQAREDLALVNRLWIDPILAVLGYRARIATEEAERAPPGCLGLLLEEAVRRRGQVSSAVTRATVVTKPGADLARLDEGTPRGFAAWLCERHGVTQAILTDGHQWTVHQEGRTLAPPAIDLLAALDDPRTFESFLWHFLSEVS